MNSPQGPILILGASTRAAAQSAARAGWEPICADLFADEDLRQVARVLTYDGYPAGLAAAAANAPSCPWMYVGAVENHPRLIAEISRSRPLWGNSLKSLARCRNPQAVGRLLRESGLPPLDVLAAADRPPADGSWMLKPLRSGGGRGVRVWDRQAAAGGAVREPHYFQRRQSGSEVSGFFLATSAGTPLIGVARQLVGQPWLYASTHQFCGSLGPISLEPRVMGQIEQIGRMLAKRCGLRGLFGCDFMCTAEDAWLTEINPRYTASAELFEFAYSVPVLGWHARACSQFADESGAAALCREVASAAGGSARPAPDVCIGKAIVFAGQDLQVPRLDGIAGTGGDCLAGAGGDPDLSIGSLPRLADRPAEGTEIRAGQPICTVLAAAASEADCRVILQEETLSLGRRLFP